jgi:hypothetical protein
MRTLRAGRRFTQRHGAAPLPGADARLVGQLLPGQRASQLAGQLLPRDGRRLVLRFGRLVLGVAGPDVRGQRPRQRRPGRQERGQRASQLAGQDGTGA